MVYLAELLVVMTDRLKIVRILARNVPRTRTQVLRRRCVSRSHLSPGIAMVTHQRAVLLKVFETHKKSSPGNLRMSSSGVKQESCRNSMFLHFDTNSEQSDCNKSSVR